VTLAIRPLGRDDAQAVAELLAAYDLFHTGETDGASADDVLDWWRRIAPDGYIGVLDDDGAIIAVGTLRERGADYYLADNFVHPDHCGKGIGTFLLDWAERRSYEDGKSSLRTATTVSDEAGRRLFDSRGYRYIRSFYRMVVDLDEPPLEPVWPEGFRVARLRPGEERALYEVIEGAFEDHWGHEPRTFEEWSSHIVNLPDRLSYLVRDSDGTPAAGAICDEERFGTGFVQVLGTLREFRRRGLGDALLRQAFFDLYALGRRRVALGVDAENTTGALRLYERAGMVVSWQDDAYEKILDPAGSEGGSKLAGS
jgi:ribosomal protein S18 acetylase RimI-like enzyme